MDKRSKDRILTFLMHNLLCKLRDEDYRDRSVVLRQELAKLLEEFPLDYAYDR